MRRRCFGQGAVHGKGARALLVLGLLLGPPFFLRAADCNLNGREDEEEIARGATPDCNQNGVPDDCDLARSFRFDRVDQYPVGGVPHIIAAGDLDADGDLDLVTSNRADDTLSILINDGKGSFSPGETLLVGNEPRGIVIADVDGDGGLDIVCGNGSEDNAGDLPTNSILVNRGNAAFRPRVDYLANTSQAGALRSVRFTDLDGDSRGDILDGFSQSDPGGVITMLFNEVGLLFSEPRVLSGDEPGFESLGTARYVVTGRINGDDLPDIVTLGGQILFNLGGGRLSSPRTFATIDNTVAICLSDLDQDGAPDVVFTRSFLDGFELKGEATPFLNRGGDLKASTAVSVPLQVGEGVDSADFDGDGDRDIAFTLHDSRIGILLNDGAGALSLVEDFPQLDGGVPRSILAADLDGDGKPDLALPKANDTVSILLNGGTWDRNGDRIPDECGRRLFHRGDSTGDGGVSITDAIVILLFLFAGAKSPDCKEAGDVDNDGAITITDPISVLHFLFLGGPHPAQPGPPPFPCGPDPDAPGARGDLGCESYEPCDAPNA
jgi:hypothetical protein